MMCIAFCGHVMSFDGIISYFVYIYLFIDGFVNYVYIGNIYNM